MQQVDHTLTAEEIRGLVGTSPLMLEIGSHDGSDTERFLEAMPGIHIHCFEPDPRPLARFKDTLRDDWRVSLWAWAVADLDGYSDFHASTGQAGGKEDWDYSGSLQRPTGHFKHSPEIGFKSPVSVRCMRLDTWLVEYVFTGKNPNQPFCIDFIWADVQGAQRKLLRGGPMGLAVTKYLYMECHHEPLYEGEPTQDELIDLLPGFEPVAIYDRDNLLFQNRHLHESV